MPATYIKETSKFPEGLTLLSSPTPNGHKISLFLEFLRLSYHVKRIDVFANEQKQDWFLKLNPNGKIPVLLNVGKDGEIIDAVFESAAILIYLADKFDKDFKYHYAASDPHYYEELVWIFFQMANLGPNQTNLLYFLRLCPENIPYCIVRYTDEVNRVYNVLEGQLKKNGTGYLVGNKLTLADFTTWPWVNRHKFSKISMEKFPVLEQWRENIAQLEITKIATNIPPSEAWGIIED
ncbi:hypothetical protein PACTADRAFT_31211 [Pachysolen tannophilus NRRL Y-2460]|uniref:Glutathione S-transferase n=1 Tax=Pachysolen tannophilus NRRL Y-2460 TaxID=669874 RepID=A0A1E4U194_PACTA|nr:hypothetical protein PACTADRAFT_31211 [Pachysolen tannophilus NRRL Y-2460]